MSVTHTVSVVLSFAVAPAKAAQVLEKWNEKKGERKRYMRDYRAGRVARAAAGRS